MLEYHSMHRFSTLFQPDDLLSTGTTIGDDEKAWIVEFKFISRTRSSAHVDLLIRVTVLIGRRSRTSSVKVGVWVPCSPPNLCIPAEGGFPVSLGYPNLAISSHASLSSSLSKNANLLPWDRPLAPLNRQETHQRDDISNTRTGNHNACGCFSSEALDAILRAKGREARQGVTPAPAPDNSQTLVPVWRRQEIHWGWTSLSTNRSRLLGELEKRHCISLRQKHMCVRLRTVPPVQHDHELWSCQFLVSDSAEQTRLVSMSRSA
ncbi:hypothetical protein QBC43DRAFT_140421 [Cladorrhinum sp. PSN259]|nr:hypothetical protein QBC43DRAFT_140421 [Cladorrhinum sp. PSN259]